MRMGGPKRVWRARAFVGPALSVLVLTVVAGCSWLDEPITPQPEEFLTPTTIAGAPDAPLVILVGDSIAQFSRDQLTTSFTTRGWANAVVGHSGSRTADNRGRILGAIQQRPEVLVIELGTNDALWSDAPSEVRTPTQREERVDAAVDQITDVVADVASVPCVVWVDINDWTDTELLRLATTAPSINQAIAELDAAREWLHVAPYRDTFAPETPEASAFLAQNFDPEGLHPVSVAARERFAALVADTVSASCFPA